LVRNGGGWLLSLAAAPLDREEEVIRSCDAEG
jgi:hypothetical protein